MKRNILIVLSLLGFTSLAAAANSIKIINHCPYNIWFWTVGPAGSNIKGPDESHIMVPGNHGSVIHGLVNTELLGGGVSLKIRDYPKYEIAPAGIVQIEYHLEPTTNAVWYDLSAIDCDRNLGPNHPSFCPLVGGGIKLYIPGDTEGECPPAWCSNDECVNTYRLHGHWPGEPTFRCKPGVDIFLETCTERVGPRTFQDSPLDPYSPVPEPVPQGPLLVSPDGTCGGPTGYTCTGSRWGDCCSAYGYCGTTLHHCDVECQGPFGICPSLNPVHTFSPPIPDYIPAATSAHTSWISHYPKPFQAIPATRTETLTEIATQTVTQVFETVNTHTRFMTQTVYATHHPQSYNPPSHYSPPYSPPPQNPPSYSEPAYNPPPHSPPPYSPPPYNPPPYSPPPQESGARKAKRHAV